MTEVTQHKALNTEQGSSTTEERQTVMADSQRLGLLPTAGGSIVAAVILVVIVYFVAKGAGDDLLVAPEVGTGTPEELKLGVAIAAVVFGGIVGAVLTVLARRFTPRPRMFFLAVSLLGLTLYGILAFVRAEETSTAIWLNTMHIAAAVPIVGGLMRLLPRQLDA